MQVAFTSRIAYRRNARSRYRLRWLSDITEQEGDKLLVLINAVIARGDSAIGYPEPLTLEEGRALITNLRSGVISGAKHLLIAEDADEIIGQVIITPHTLPNCRHLAELTRGIIHPKIRGNGVLQSAFIEIIKRCEGLGISRLVLDVRDTSAAYALWKKVGFEVYGKLEDYVRIGAERFSGSFMTASVARLRETFLKV